MARYRNNTVLTISYDSTPTFSGSAETDVIYQEGAFGMPDHVSGVTWCNDPVDGSKWRCDQSYIRMRGAGRINAKVATHETGHSSVCSTATNGTPRGMCVPTFLASCVQRKTAWTARRSEMPSRTTSTGSTGEARDEHHYQACKGSEIPPLALIVASCATWVVMPGGADPVASSPASPNAVFFVQPLEENASETVPDWASGADLVVKAVVTAERAIEPRESETSEEDRFDLVGRTVSLKVSDVIWRSPNATEPNPRPSLWMRSGGCAG